MQISFSRLQYPGGKVALNAFETRQVMSKKKIYDDIPGTIVFDSDQAARGYHLNQFCISLRLAPNRAPEQREAALNQEWNLLLELGGNIYYTSKLAAYHGINFQGLAGCHDGSWRSIYRWQSKQIGVGR